MDLGTIGVRYARALLKYATELKQEDTVYNEMLTMAKVYTLEPQLRRAIENPSLTSEQKEKTLYLAAGGSTCDATKHFIKFVVAKQRADVMQFIANSYVSLYLASKNIVKSRIVVPTDISEKIVAKLRSFVENRTDSNVEFVIETDPSIGGGFILEYGTYRIDATIESQVSKLKNRLLNCNN